MRAAAPVKPINRITVDLALCSKLMTEYEQTGNEKKLQAALSNSNRLYHLENLERCTSDKTKLGIYILYAKAADHSAESVKKDLDKFIKNRQQHIEANQKILAINPYAWQAHTRMIYSLEQILDFETGEKQFSILFNSLKSAPLKLKATKEMVSKIFTQYAVFLALQTEYVKGDVKETYRKALYYAQKAVELNPKNAAAISTLAKCLGLLSHHDEVARYRGLYEKARVSQPDRLFDLHPDLETFYQRDVELSPSSPSEELDRSSSSSSSSSSSYNISQRLDEKKGESAEKKKEKGKSHKKKTPGKHSKIKSPDQSERDPQSNLFDALSEPEESDLPKLEESKETKTEKAPPELSEPLPRRVKSAQVTSKDPESVPLVQSQTVRPPHHKPVPSLIKSEKIRSEDRKRGSHLVEPILREEKTTRRCNPCTSFHLFRVRASQSLSYYRQNLRFFTQTLFNRAQGRLPQGVLAPIARNPEPHEHVQKIKKGQEKTRLKPK